MFALDLYEDRIEQIRKRGYADQVAKGYALGCMEERIELLVSLLKHQINNRGLSFSSAAYLLGLSEAEEEGCYPYVIKEQNKPLPQLVEEMHSSGEALTEQGRLRGDTQRLLSLFEIASNKLGPLKATVFLDLSKEDKDRIEVAYARQAEREDSIGLGIYRDGIAEGDKDRLLSLFKTVMDKLDSFEAAVEFFELSPEDREVVRKYKEEI